MKSYSLSFFDETEIRMGSPFMKASLLLDGEFVPNLAGHDFQNVGLVSRDGRRCVLVEWFVEDNSPGVKFWIVDGQARRVEISKKFKGACLSISEGSASADFIAELWHFDEGTRTQNVYKVML